MVSEDNFIVNIELNAANVRGSLQNIANGLAEIRGGSAETDKVIANLERTIVKLTTSMDGAGAATSAATGKQSAYASSLAAVRTQLELLEKAQRAVSEKQLSQVQLPASLPLARDAGGRITGGRSVDNLNLADSRAIATAYDLESQSLYRLNAAHLAEMEATGTSTKAEAAYARRIEASSAQTAIYNQYLYDQAKAKAAAASVVPAATGNSNALGATRNALTNTARDLTAVGLGLVALSILPAIVSTAFEREFAQVTRTVDGAGKDIKDQLISLSQNLPVSFKDLAGIAALGGQLGIAKSGIVDFTSVVAKLTATTNLTSDAAGTALGRFQALLGVPSSQFEALASAILKVGVTSVATETQIVGIATQISGISRLAGLTAPQVIGLSGALASVGAAPELSRGTITRTFSLINNAVHGTTDTLSGFAKLAGVSSEDFRKAFGTDKFSPIFTSLVKGLGDTTRNGGDAVKALNDLGIRSVRDVPLLLRLSAASQDTADSMGLLGRLQRDSLSSYTSATELNRQYGIVAGTTSAKIKELVNEFAAFFNSIGSAQQGPLNELVTGLGDFLKTMTAIASTSDGQTFLTIAAVIGLVVGVLALLFGAAAKGAASILGLTQSLIGLNTTGLLSNGVMAGLAAELRLVGGLGPIAATGVTILSKALSLMLPITLALGIAYGAFALAGNMAKSQDVALSSNINFKKLTASTQDATAAIDEYLKKAQVTGSMPIGRALFGAPIVPGEKASKDPLVQAAQRVTRPADPVGAAVDSFSSGYFGRNSGLTQSQEAIGKVDAALAGLVKGGNGAKALALFDGLTERAGKGGVNVSDFAARFTKYNKEVDKATDGAKQLAVATAAVNSGMASQQSLISVLSNATGMSGKEQTKFAASYQKSIAPLTGFNNIVGEVQAKLSDAAAKAALNSSKSPKSFYDGIAVSLTQFTDQLNTNNAAQVVWGENITQVAAKYGPAAADSFIQAGYTAVNNSILKQLVDATPEQGKKYADAMAEQARLAGFATAQGILASGYIINQAGDYVGTTSGDATAKKFAEMIASGIGVPEAMAALGLKVASQKQPEIIFTFTMDPIQAKINDLIARNDGRRINIFADLYGTPAGVPPLIAAPPAPAKVNPFHRAQGGAIWGAGSATSDSIPAMLSNGEFVIRAASVRQYGSGLFDSLNRGVARFANGGQVGPVAAPTPQSGISVVALSAADKGLLVRIANALNLSIDGKDIARASGAANLVAVAQRQRG